jgi:hypothetical protein
MAMFKTVHLPADAGLARLLRTAGRGTAAHRHFGALATAASPGHAQRAVELPVSLVPVIADGLRGLLARARAAADPAAGALAAFLAGEFGVTEGVPVPGGEA